jgi:hypothetical protein
MQSAFGDADAPIVVELAQIPGSTRAFREVGRVMRTVALLGFLADSGLRARVTGPPTRPRPTTGSPPGPRFGNQGVIAENDPAEQEQLELAACNLMVYHSAIDMMEVIRQLVAEGWQVTAEDLAQLSPYLTSPHPPVRRLRNRRTPIPPDVFDPALEKVDFGGEQHAAA